MMLLVSVIKLRTTVIKMNFEYRIMKEMRLMEMR